MSQCWHIAMRSEAKDGAVPPEPVGPKEVARHKRQTPSRTEPSDDKDLTDQFARNLVRR